MKAKQRIRITVAFVVLTPAFSDAQVRAFSALWEDRTPSLHEDIYISSWDNLDQDLRNTVRGGTDLGAYEKSPVFTKVQNTNNVLLWNSMLADSDRPFVVIAGYYCLSELHPEAAYSAGLRVIAGAKTPGSLIYAPIYEKLNKYEMSQIKESDLDAIYLNQSHVLLESLSAATTLVPRPIVATWLQTEKVSKSQSIVVAVAIDHVLSGEDKSLLPAEFRDQLLDSLAVCPGYPRYIFSVHREPADASYLAVLRSTLGDPQLSELHISVLADRRSDVIKHHFDTLTKGLPEARILTIKNIVDKIK